MKRLNPVTGLMEEDLSPPPMIAAPTVPVAPAPVAPTAVREVAGGSGSTTREVPTANELALNKKIAESGTRMADIAGNEGLAKVHAAEGNEIASALAADAATVSAQRRESVAGSHDEILNRLNSVQEAELKRLNGMKIEEFGAGEPAWKHIGRAVAIGLGELGRSLSKGNHNAAADIVSQQMAEHYQVQRARIEKQKETVAGARQQVGDARLAKADSLVNFDAQELARTKALAAQVDAEAARVGTEYARTQAEKIKEAATQHALLVSQNIEQGLRAKSVQGQEWRKTEGPVSAPGAGTAHVKGDSNVYKPDGSVLLDVGDPKKAAEINKSNAAFGNLTAIMSELEKSYREHGRVVPGSAEAKRRKALVSQGTLAVKNNEDLGALVGGDWKIVGDQIGDGAAVYVTSPLPTMNETLRQVQAKHERYLGSKGLPGAQIAPMFRGAATERPSSPPVSSGNVLQLKDGRKVRQLPNGRYEEVAGG